MSLMQNGLKMAAVTLLSGAALFGLAGQAAAQVSFKGKTIDVIMGSAPGGGTDGTTRLVGSFLEKYLPGNPTMRYRNVPGGHGTKGLNFFAKAKPDGLTWAGGSSSHVDPNSLTKDVVEYNPTKFGFFGGVSRGGSIVFIRKEKLANLTDKSKPPAVAGVIDGNRSWEQLITFGAEMLNWNVKFVVGYPGTSFLLLAVRRGETDMMGTSNVALLKEMFDTGQAVGLTQMGGGPADGDVEARTNFEKIPTFEKLVEGKGTPEDRRAFEFWTALNDIDKWYALPPGTPKEIVEVYRAAWDKIVKDPEFVRMGKLQFSADFSPIPGSKQQDMVEKTAYPDKAITNYMEALKAKYGLPAEPLSDEQLAALAKSKGLDKADVPAIKAKLSAVGDGGRDITFSAEGASKKMDVSSSRTNVTIAGQKAARGDLKAGMECNIVAMGNELSAVNCN